MLQYCPHQRGTVIYCFPWNRSNFLEHLDNSLRLFCQELTKARAQNLALMVDGNEAAANAVKKILAEVAQNNAVYDEVLYIKGGLPIIGGSVKPEEKATIIEWVDRVIANLK